MAQDRPEPVQNPIPAFPDLSPYAGLLGELVELARRPDQFHGSALDVIRRLRMEFDRDPGPAIQGDPDAVDGLLATVVFNDDETDLVRGAVLLAAATYVSAVEYSTLLDVILGNPDSPSELVRAVAIGAVLRGEPAKCGDPMSLRTLGRFQASRELGRSKLPGVYPVALGRRVAPEAAIAIKEWISAEHPMRALIDDPSNKVGFLDGVSEVDEYLVTIEVLAAAWGTAAVGEPKAVKWIIDGANMNGNAEAEPSSLRLFTACNFLLYSLASCSGDLLREYLPNGETKNEMVLAMRKRMHGMGRENVSEASVERIQAIRYSNDTEERIALTNLLFGLSHGGLNGSEIPFTDFPFASSQKLLTTLSELALDPMMSRKHRSLAFRAIRRTGCWNTLLSTSTALLKRHANDDLYADVMSAFTRVARSDTARHESIVKALGGALKVETRGPWAAEAEALGEILRR